MTDSIREPSKRIRLRSKRVFVLRRLAAVIFISALVAPITFIIYGVMILRLRDNPTRVYQHYSRELEQYVSRLQSGQVACDSQGPYATGDYAIPQFLIGAGARHVRKQGDCFVITFEYMMTDSVPQLWFSPSGCEPLPTALEEIKEQRKTFQWRQLSSKWGECYWDD
jgi:hypothetical protein